MPIKQAKKLVAPAGVRLWRDVPARERVTEAILADRGMAQHDGWIERQLLRQTKPDCQAAVPYAPWDGYYKGIWQPCGKMPAPGQQFCAHHGGGLASSIETLIAQRTRLEHKLARYERHIRELELAIAEIRAKMATIDEKLARGR